MVSRSGGRAGNAVDCGQGPRCDPRTGGGEAAARNRRLRLTNYNPNLFFDEQTAEPRRMRGDATFLYGEGKTKVIDPWQELSGRSLPPSFVPSAGLALTVKDIP